MIKLYFLEIRNRVGLIVLVWISTFFVSYLYKETLLFLMVKPLVNSYPQACTYFIATSLTEIFSSFILISFFVGNQLTGFFLLIQILIFFSTALYNYEFIRLRNLILFSFFLWLLNMFALNSFIFSYVINFFMGFQDTLHREVTSLHYEIKIIEYLNFYKNVFFLSAMSFQIFLLIFLFVNNLTDKIGFIKKYRKLFFFAFFSLATLISPPDIFSQLFLGVSFIFIFEFLILIVFFINNLSEKKKLLRKAFITQLDRVLDFGPKS